MFVRYRSDYSNQVHQLLVSVSRHLYVTVDDRVVRQNKPFTVTLDTLNRSRKEHIVHYLVRDHYSGHFYAEVARSMDLIEPQAFLFRAWSIKEQHFFRGIPEMITVPATVSRAFPDLKLWLSACGIHVVEPTSGFQAGVRDLKTWEDELWSDIAYSTHSFAETQKVATIRSFLLSTDSINGESKLARWSAGLRGPAKIPKLADE